MSDAGVPILMYHAVSPHPHPSFRRYTVTPLDFDSQMRWLVDTGYEAVDMNALLAARRDQGVLPAQPIVITFDDGLQSCADHAMPVLRDCGFTAVFYLVAGLVGDTSGWMRGDPGVDLPLMDWDTVRDLEAQGCQLGAHTVTHPRLTELDAARCREELEGARERLERELGHPPMHLAYPFGDWNAAVRDMAAEVGYATACSTTRGMAGPTDDPLALPRITIYGHDSLADFRSRVRTGRALGERFAGVLGGLVSRLRPGASQS